MIYIILVLIAAIMVGATWIALAKPGKDDGICQYGHKDE